MGSATDGITRGILADETSAFFGEGLTIATYMTKNADGSIAPEATASLNLGNLFNFDTFLSLYNAGTTCEKDLYSSSCISSMVGVGANFDPTGISNLLAVFI